MTFGTSPNIDQMLEDFNLTRTLAGDGEADPTLLAALKAAGIVAASEREESISPGHLLAFVYTLGQSDLHDYLRGMGRQPTLSPNNLLAIINQDSTTSATETLDPRVKLALIGARILQDENPALKGKPLTLEAIFVWLYPLSNDILTANLLTFTVKMYCWRHKVGGYENKESGKPQQGWLFAGWSGGSYGSGPTDSSSDRPSLFPAADMSKIAPQVDAAMEGLYEQLRAAGIDPLNPLAAL